MSDPPVLYRPSDNAKFVRYGESYCHENSISPMYTLKLLLSLGFRDYSFTNSEMEYYNPIRLECKINDVPLEIVISQREWRRVLGED